MKKHDRMKAACAEKMAQTQGKCVEECLQIGWCKDVYKAVGSKGKASGDQSGSGAFAPSAND